MNMAIGAEDKKKLIALGVLVVAVLAILVYVFTRNSSPSPEMADMPPAEMNPDMPPGEPGVPGGAPAQDAAPAGGGGGSGNITAASFASLSGLRADPFTPEYILPPPPPLELPPPEMLPTPQEESYAGLPPAFVATNTPSNVMQGLPPINIPKLRNVATSPQKFEAPQQAGGTPLATPSFNKRLSGVIIGDSVHALLEISSANGTQTYVVQPGDTVAGIRILSIQRVDMGGKTVPRLLISENGDQKYVDLRASFSPQVDMQPGGMGPDGMPGDYPGNPAIIPAPNIPPQQSQAGQGSNPFSAY